MAAGRQKVCVVTRDVRPGREPLPQQAAELLVLFDGDDAESGASQRCCEQTVSCASLDDEIAGARTAAVV